MKHYLLPVFLITAFLVSSCSLILPTVKQQQWLSQSNAPAKPTASLQISGAEMAGHKIRLFVHVTDSTHTFTRNLPSDAFCNPSIRYNGQEYPVQNFKVTEYQNVQRDRTAYALVLDHSGSMKGAKQYLYQATRQLLQNKREQDAYSIVRYAHEPTVDVPLTAEKQILLDQFNPEPHQYVGTHTATWDGLAEGVSTLQTSAYSNRILIVFTDGGENASKLSQEWAFWRAKTAGIKVVTISLGQGGAQNMQALCASTGGMYMPINHISEITQAYTDLENKLGSYYLVEFETPIMDKQSVQLNVCQNFNFQDTYTFDNRPAGPEPERMKQTNSSTASTATPRTPVASTPGSGSTRPVGTTPPTVPTRPTSTTPTRPVTVSLPGGSGTSTPSTPTRGGTTVSNGGRTGSSVSTPRP